jgi:3-oxoacyl-[acyl-carrier protein] reductase
MSRQTGPTTTLRATESTSAAEFGATCAFLCSTQAGYITGQNILIDGGAYPGTF